MGRQNNRLSELFSERPPHWGLRGDPYLWEDMKKTFADVEMPADKEEITQLISNTFKKLTGRNLNDEVLFSLLFIHLHCSGF